MVKEVRPLQPEKTFIPMLVTPSAILTEVKPSQLEKA